MTTETMTYVEKVDWLADLFRQAKWAAVAADPGEENDGGTCNFDTPCFAVPEQDVHAVGLAAGRAGLTVTPVDRFAGVNYWLMVPLRGQAHRRTRMMEAAQDVLNKAAESGAFPGFRAFGWYQMD
jgi:hypothetical protein